MLVFFFIFMKPTKLIELTTPHPPPMLINNSSVLKRLLQVDTLSHSAEQDIHFDKSDYDSRHPLGGRTNSQTHTEISSDRHRGFTDRLTERHSLCFVDLNLRILFRIISCRIWSTDLQLCSMTVRSRNTCVLKEIFTNECVNWVYYM